MEFISCATCLNATREVGELVGGCNKDAAVCLVKPRMGTFQYETHMPFAYLLYSGIIPDLFGSLDEPEPEKPICFDCPETRWCGDCVDALRCMESDQCSDCQFEEECGMDEVFDANDQLVIDPSECDGGSCDNACDMNCQEDFDFAKPHTHGDNGVMVGQALKTLEPLLTFKASQPTMDFIEADEVFHENNGQPSYMRPEPLVEPLEELPEGAVSGRNYDAIEALSAQDAMKKIDDHIVEPVVEALTKLNEEDVVLHPNHYAEADIPSGIECWDWYELAMTEEEVTGHFKGNALKYIFRAGRKGDAIQDLDKARNYLARWIGYLKGDRTVHMRGKKHDG